MLASRGFTIFEVLVAMSLSSILMTGTMRLLPALQRAVLNQSQLTLMREDLWQIAFSIGKQVQRAGYCHGDCNGTGLNISDNGSCVIVQWDANHNGKWENAAAAEPEQTGYRLRDKSIEIQRGAAHCAGKGWEKLTDPTQFQVERFVAVQIPRSDGHPLISISLSASMTSDPSRSVDMEQQVVGYNL